MIADEDFGPEEEPRLEAAPTAFLVKFNRASEQDTGSSRKSTLYDT